jgi:uncharacterized membrane protein HdeD (DUF308 family)
MWALLLFAGVAWLAIGWSVLRLEPANIVTAAGPVILFGALTEALRACAGTRTWWLNAGMAVLFLATGVVLLAERESSYTTPAALVGWYLMVRGTLDVAVAMLTRESDRVWSLLMVVGVMETGLGFFAASPLSRTADLMVVVVGGLGLLRAVADVVTALRLRETRQARSHVQELPPERALGLTGYSAGMADYESAPPHKPRHRAQPRSSSGLAALSRDAGALSGAAGALAGGAGAETAMWPGGPAETRVTGGGTAADAVPGALPAAGGMAAAGYVAAGAGVTGAGVGAHLDDYEMPAVPDTPEGVEAPAVDAGSAPQESGRRRD